MSWLLRRMNPSQDLNVNLTIIREAISTVLTHSVEPAAK
jgi:hypothetical protein